MKSKNINVSYFSKMPEFQDLRFGESEDCILYFDATHYIIQKGDIKKHTIREFELVFNFCICTICDCYEVQKEDLIVRDFNTGHIFFDEVLAFPFIMYIDPMFLVYALERINELFTNGFTISDTALLILAKERLNNEVLNQLLNEKDEKE